jgi:hypothetical protein
MGRIITISVGYAWAVFSKRVKAVFSYCFVCILCLAYGGIEAYQDVRLPGVLTLGVYFNNIFYI